MYTFTYFYMDLQCFYTGNNFLLHYTCLFELKKSLFVYDGRHKRLAGWLVSVLWESKHQKYWMAFIRFICWECFCSLREENPMTIWCCVKLKTLLLIFRFDDMVSNWMGKVKGLSCTCVGGYEKSKSDLLNESPINFSRRLILSISATLCKNDER